jgi:hypothetical protein
LSGHRASDGIFQFGTGRGATVTGVAVAVIASLAALYDRVAATFDAAAGVGRRWTGVGVLVGIEAVKDDVWPERRRIIGACPTAPAAAAPVCMWV